jgi:hypothetical protein
VEAPKINPNKIPRMTARKVNSGKIVLAGTYGSCVALLTTGFGAAIGKSPIVKFLA